MDDPGPVDPTRSPARRASPRRAGAWLGPALAVTGAAAALVAVSLRPSEARGAASQVWPPFVLVVGLLLVGLVAHADGLFETTGRHLARRARSGGVIFAGMAVTVGAVTAILNLDTAVAFLTPVFVHVARSRGEDDAPLVIGCVLLANAGSLFLPGSNLTNLIVLGHLHLTGGTFLAHMWAPGLAGVAVTALVVAFVQRPALRVHNTVVEGPDGTMVGLGLVAVALVTVVVLLTRSPALPVLAVGVVVVAVRIASGTHRLGDAVRALGLPVLVGLFGLATAFGTLGRAWSGPADLLAHLGIWATAPVAALCSIVLNNLPAAALLAAHRPPHPFALLIGLNLGPNLFVSGSLAWFLWLHAARSAGAEPSLARATLMGAATVPFALAAAVGALALGAAH